MSSARGNDDGISKRAARIEASATLAISSEAKRLRAAGEPVIGFGAGEPDFPTPDYIVEAAAIAARDPSTHRYTPAAGLPELREAISASRLADGPAVDAGQVVVTNGAKQAVFTAFQVLLDPGDEVLVPAPYWVTYPTSIALAGGVPVFIDTDDAAEFQVTVDQLEQARTGRTKALLFVSPSNPTGAVYDRDRMTEIGRWAVEHDIWVVTDEIYHRLVYGDTPFYSLPAVVPELADHTIVVNGVSKTYAMTGWRVGWLIGPPAVAEAATRLQSHVSSNVANVSQRAAVAALTGPDDAPDSMRAAFDKRRGTMVRMLNEVPGIECANPGGAFYTFPNVSGLFGADLSGHAAGSSMELAALLLDRIQIAIVPGEAFGAPGYARFSFAIADDELEEGLNRLQRFVG
ncbi:MAG: pyridoxal phosphate-dependent aminotransferase [Acidimicrobiia bacterium]|nr:MAG: pyridoxal phosphate-dependent aminotransferase [Acidimicrobiia bacterium]